MADYHEFPDAPEGTPESKFVHLHVHSDYSLLDGCSKLDTLVAKAKSLNMKALALTDHGNMFGVLNFEHLCHVNKINPICGEEFYVSEGSRKEKNPTRYSEQTMHKKYNYHLILLCKNAEGYKNLCWLSSLAFTEGLYYKPRIDFELLEKYHEGLICLSACVAGELPQALLADDDKGAEELALKYQNLFGKENYFIEVQDHAIKEERYVAPKLIALAKKLDIPMVVTNDIHYANQDDAEAQDALLCIGTKRLITDTDRMKFANDSFYLKTENEMRMLFPDYPELIDNTMRVAQMCNLVIPQYKTQELKDCLPVYQIPKEFVTQDAYVLHLVENGLKKRYGTVTPEIVKRAMYELGIIFQMGFSGYFLIVWDFINWSKTHDVPIGPGRGSGAGSLVAYAMTITDIDPFKYNLIFERFLNPERVSMPDFDVDMCFEGRQRVIQYTRDHYGDEQVGHIITFGTLKAKNALADVGRVLGIPLSDVNMLKKAIPNNPKAKLKDAFTPPDDKNPDNGQLLPYKDDPKYKKLFELAFKLENVTKNTGLHASGIVIGKSVLPEWAPVYKDSKTGKVAVQYTMDIIEPCGLVKMDYLGLKTLTLIKYAEKIIHKRPGFENFFAERDIPIDDKETFDLFCRGDAVAIFQFESPGMQKILKQAQPRKIEELVALNALYRPGPMDYIPQYIDGKLHPENVHYPDPCLEGILKETYGVMVYQEQVMQVAQKIAGFSLGGADMLRRAMGKKKKEVLMGKKKEFIEGAIKNGFTEEHADKIFDIMVPFAGYGFNKSHAAAYSVVAYRTGYLKVHFPAEFIAANLTNEISTTDKLPEYIAEGRAMGLEVDPPDVNRSDVVFDVVDGKIVFGLMGIKGMGEAAALAIIEERKENGPYKSFMDFLKRAGVKTDSEGKILVNKKAIEVLIRTGAFEHTGESEGLNLNRPTLLRNMEAAISYAIEIQSSKNSNQGDLFSDIGEEESTYTDFVFIQVENLPRMDLLNMEMECIGCYVSGHPLDDYKKAISKAVNLKSSNMSRVAAESKAEKDALVASGAKFWQLKDAGKVYTALGMLSSLRVIHTKTGKDMAFAKLEDYEGTLDCTFFPEVWATLRLQIHDNGIYAFKGTVDGSRDTPSLLVKELCNTEELELHSIQSVHIMMDSSFSEAVEIAHLRDFLFDKSGNCSVYFHMNVDKKPFVVKGNDQMAVSCTDDVLSQLRTMPYVKEVWTE
jgi:DNA polymerase III subunit alpha